MFFAPHDKGCGKHPGVQAWGEAAVSQWAIMPIRGAAREGSGAPRVDVSLLQVTLKLHTFSINARTTIKGASRLSSISQMWKLRLRDSGLIQHGETSKWLNQESNSHPASNPVLATTLTAGTTSGPGK